MYIDVTPLKSHPAEVSQQAKAVDENDASSRSNAAKLKDKERAGGRGRGWGAEPDSVVIKYKEGK